MAKKKDTEKKPLDLYQALAEQTNGEVLGQMKAAKYFIDTGNLAFNFIASGKFVDGGLPGGRISEFYGPSSSAKSLWATNLLFGCQKLGGYAILLDCENASNPEWIRKASHLDVDKVIRYTPKTLEEAFLKMYNVIKFIRKHDKDVPIMIVYDSITVSPTARALKELDLPDNYSEADFKRIVQRHEQPGERAKVISTELMKLNGLMEEMDATILIVNQVRQAIGVMYGCFHYNTRVMLADGTTEKIGKIVNQKLPVEVLSFNQKTRKIEPKKVTAWHDNGNLGEGESFLQFTVKKSFGNGRSQFACTTNHMIFKNVDKPIENNPNSRIVFLGTRPVPTEVRADSLVVGDKVLSAEPRYLTEDQKQVVYGSILGDGSIRQQDRGAPQLRIGHGWKQADYCRWKKSILDPWTSYTEDSEDRYYFDTIPMPELSDLMFRVQAKNIDVEGNRGERDECLIPAEVSDQLGVLGLAIWYMDDGTFGGHYSKWGNGKSTLCCTKFLNREIMLPALERLGLQAKIVKRGFIFDSENTRKLHELIAPFVHPSMDYKLHPECRGKFDYEIEDIDESAVTYVPVESEILDIYEKPATRSKKKFDLTIEDNSTYLVDGTIVHNSNEVTSGGKALEFYCSQRFRTSAHKQITNPKLGKMVTGVNVKITNKKNRFFRPHAYAEGIQLLFDRGINPLSGLLEVLIQAERIIKVGTGRYAVMPDYRPEGSDETYEFTSSATRGDVPRKLVLECPRIIDAKTRDEVEAYLAPYANFEQLEAEGSIVEEDLSDMLENEINGD